MTAKEKLKLIEAEFKLKKAELFRQTLEIEKNIKFAARALGLGKTTFQYQAVKLGVISGKWPERDGSELFEC